MTSYTFILRTETEEFVFTICINEIPFLQEAVLLDDIKKLIHIAQTNYGKLICSVQG